MAGEYQRAYDESINSPESFWGRAAEEIHWFKKYDKVLDDSRKPFYSWFTGGEMNTCFLAVDYHVRKGRGDQAAIIYDSPVTNTITKLTYRELLDQVSRFAGVLLEREVLKGDRVLIYMPMIPEAVISMLACARIGAIHSVVFGGFATRELAARIDDAKPKLIVSASCGIEVNKVIEYKPLLNKAIDIASHKPEKCIIFQRKELAAGLIKGRDYDWSDLMKNAKPADCVPVKSTDPLYILYTSGTTGIPKGVVRDNGGHAVALKWTMKYLYDVDPGDVFWAASDVGWVVGHSYIVYGPLLHGCTTILYEGKPVGTPDAGAFWRVISKHRVKSFFTTPTAFRAIKRDDPTGEFFGKYDISCLKYLFLAGERTDPDTYRWASRLLNIPVVDHWWQTETGWAIAGNFMGLEKLPVKPGSVTKPAPGYNIAILDNAGKIFPSQEEGIVVLKLPPPPGTLAGLWHNDRMYTESYLDAFPGYYLTGDEGYFDKGGYIYIMGRMDDVIKVAGHRFSTGAMEEVIEEHQDVAECAVVGAEDTFKGQIPIGFVVLKAGVYRDHSVIIKELIQLMRDRIGAFASFKKVVIVNRLPKTRSGKTLRSTMRKIADGEEYLVPSTIDDSVVLNEIEDSVKTIGYGKK